MDQNLSLSLNRLLFDLGSRLGCWEGYLYPSLIFDALPSVRTCPVFP